MKTNVIILRRCFPAAALPLFILAGNLSACKPTEPVNPKPGNVYIVSPIAADTIVHQPDEPRPTKPIQNPEPEQL